MHLYAITIFADCQPGLLSRMLGVLSRRQVEIESLTAHRSTSARVCCVTVLAVLTESLVRRLAAQLEKQVGVLDVQFASLEIAKTAEGNVDEPLS